MKYFTIKDEVYNEFYTQGFIEIDSDKLRKMENDSNFTIEEVESYFDNSMDMPFIKFKVSSQEEIDFYCISLYDWL